MTGCLQKCRAQMTNLPAAADNNQIFKCRVDLFLSLMINHLGHFKSLCFYLFLFFM